VLHRLMRMHRPPARCWRDDSRNI